MKKNENEIISNKKGYKIITQYDVKKISLGDKSIDFYIFKKFKKERLKKERLVGKYYGFENNDFQKIKKYVKGSFCESGSELINLKKVILFRCDEKEDLISALKKYQSNMTNKESKKSKKNIVQVTQYISKKSRIVNKMLVKEDEIDGLEHLVQCNTNHKRIKKGKLIKQIDEVLKLLSKSKNNNTDYILIRNVKGSGSHHIGGMVLMGIANLKKEYNLPINFEPSDKKGLKIRIKDNKTVKDISDLLKQYKLDLIKEISNNG